LLTLKKCDDVAFIDATAQAELVRTGEVKPIELVDMAIERIEGLNPILNAIVTPMYERARATALEELPDGYFKGVPFLLKDVEVASYRGVPLQAGSAFARGFVPDHDSELVARLKRAGLIILGKTNTPELAAMPTTEPLLFGPTRNPWDTRLTAGGSSGGSAAAVAAGLVPMAHASDAGGSLRIPSSCCGLFGLMPTRGRTPFGPDYGDIFSGLVAEHAITRSVRDSAALLDATAGPDIGDPYVAPPPKGPFLNEVGTEVGQLKIAFTANSPINTPVHKDCIVAVQETAKLCADLGHEVIEAAPLFSDEATWDAFNTVRLSGLAWTIDGISRKTGRTPSPDQFEPPTWLLYEKGRHYSAPEYLFAIETLQRVARVFANFFVKFDVLLTPALGEPPVMLGTFDASPEDPLRGRTRRNIFSPFTRICNISGQPAMSVPLFWNADGLPIGSQFVGRFGEEGTLFRLAAQLEAARPWHWRRPPVSA
jgi:amidase